MTDPVRNQPYTGHHDDDPPPYPGYPVTAPGQSGPSRSTPHHEAPRFPGPPQEKGPQTSTADTTPETSHLYYNGYPQQEGYHSPPPPAVGLLPAQSSTQFTTYAHHPSSSAPVVAPSALSSNDFSSTSIRKGFARKVYSILMVQLIIDLIFAFTFMFHRGIGHWIYHNQIVVIIVPAIFVCILILTCCFQTMCRQTPKNIILLSIITLAEGTCVGLVSVYYYYYYSIYLLVIIMEILIFGLMLFTFQRIWNYTICSNILFVCILIPIILLPIAIFMNYNLMFLILSGIVALMYCFYVIVDIQMMMSEDRKYINISPEEYIYAVLRLQMDCFTVNFYENLGRQFGQHNKRNGIIISAPNTTML